MEGGWAVGEEARPTGEGRLAFGTHNLRKPIGDRVDFEKLKESEIIKIAAAAGILGKESVKKLEETLGKRNTAAHPSTLL